MTIFRCDTCGMEMSGDNRTDAWATAPDGWTITRVKVGGMKRMKVHFCSFECIQKFDAERYLTDFRSGALFIKRTKTSRTQKPND